LCVKLLTLLGNSRLCDDDVDDDDDDDDDEIAGICGGG
jgi:hypothetical protein